MTAEGISGIGRVFQNVAYAGPRASRGARKLKRGILAKDFLVEANDVNTFSMLRHPAGGIDHLVKDRVFQFLEGVLDDAPGPALVVRLNIFDVLQEQHRRSFVFDDRREMEKQVALGSALEPVRVSEAFFLGDASDGKRLTGEPRCEHVVIGDVTWLEGAPWFDAANVAVRSLAEPGLVRLLGVLVPLARKHALSAEPLQCDPKSADAGKKVSERERELVGRRRSHDREVGEQGRLLDIVGTQKHRQDELLLAHSVLLPLAVDPGANTFRNVSYE